MNSKETETATVYGISIAMHVSRVCRNTTDDDITIVIYIYLQL